MALLAAGLFIPAAWPQTPPAPQQTPFQASLTPKERVKLYLWQTFGPAVIGESALAGGLSQWRNNPSEWHQGMEGFGIRFGSALGHAAVDHTIESSLAAVRGEDPRYRPSGLTGFWPRTRYAIIHTFKNQSADGEETIAVSRIVGVYGGWQIARTWYPARDNSAAFGLEHGSITMGLHVGRRIFHEFWPDIQKKVFGR
jgi:hypothetical protein